MKKRADHAEVIAVGWSAFLMKEIKDKIVRLSPCVKRGVTENEREKNEKSKSFYTR